MNRDTIIVMKLPEESSAVSLMCSDQIRPYIFIYEYNRIYIAHVFVIIQEEKNRYYVLFYKIILKLYTRSSICVVYTLYLLYNIICDTGVTRVPLNFHDHRPRRENYRKKKQKNRTKLTFMRMTECVICYYNFNVCCVIFFPLSKRKATFHTPLKHL